MAYALNQRGKEANASQGETCGTSQFKKAFHKIPGGIRAPTQFERADGVPIFT